MKKTVLYLFSIFCCLFFVFSVSAVSYPSPAGFVNDFAGIYSAGYKTQLENNLSDFEKQTGAEIAVVTIKSLEGENLEDYAVRLFEKWKIGKKGTDNGLLLLISKDDRKIRIEVGYGLEPYINDGRAGEIIRNQMSPEFKKDNYEGGTLAAITQLEKYISDQDVAPKTSSSKSSDDFGGLIVFAIIIFYIIVSYIAGYLGRTKQIWPGGILGGVLGGIGGLIFLSVIGLITGAILFGGIGLLLDFILSKNYQVRKKKGLPTGFFHTWGGFGGGGGGGWGGGGGGFGGGSSGGGGGSGGW